jgi:hypothetical protein
MPNLVWRDDEISILENNEYSTSVLTYFPLSLIEVPLFGDVNIGSIDLVISGTVNVDTEDISSLEIQSLTISTILTSENEEEYVGSTTSDKYHKPDCGKYP